MDLQASLLAGLALTLASFLAGQLLRGGRAQASLTPSSECFLSLLFGFLALTSSYAIVKTSGVSLLGLILVLLLPFITRPSAKALRRQLKSLGLFVLGLGLWIGVCWTTYGGNDRRLEAHADLGFYAQVSQTLRELGCEAYYGPRVFVSESFRKPVPYHYVDLWSSAWVSQVCGLTDLESLLVTQPFFIALACLGAFALTGSLLMSSMLPLASGVVAPARLFADSWLIGYALPWFMYPPHLVNRPKLALTVALFLAASILLKEARLPPLALLCLGIAIVSSATLWPAGLIAGVLACLAWYRRGAVTKSQCITLLAVTLSLAVSLVTFYRIFGASSLAGAPALEVKTVAIGFIKALTYLLPNAALLWFLHRLRPDGLWANITPEARTLMGCTWIGSLGALPLFQTVPDGFQVLTEPLYSTLAIGSSLAAANLLTGLRQTPFLLASLRGVLVGCLIGSWLSHSVPFYRAKQRIWSPEFEATVVDTLEDVPNARIALLSSNRSLEEFIEERLRGGVALSELGMPLLWHRSLKVWFLNISDPFLVLSKQPEVRKFQETSLSNQSLTRFAQENRRLVDTETILVFLAHFQVRYVLLDRYSTVPSWLQDLVEREYHDPASNERFLVLKSW